MIRNKKTVPVFPRNSFSVSTSANVERNRVVFWSEMMVSTRSQNNTAFLDKKFFPTFKVLNEPAPCKILETAYPAFYALDFKLKRLEYYTFALQPLAPHREDEIV